MRQVLPAPTGNGAFFSEWYLVPEASFALMPLPLVIQDRLKARKLSICPSQGIYVQASRPGLNKIPFQLVQLFANHKTNSYVDRTPNAKRKRTRTLPDFGSCFVKRAKRTSRRPEPLSLRRNRRLPETIPAPAAQPPSRLPQCAPVVCSYQSQRVQLCTAASNNICCPETWKYQYS